ncbi:MAG TPA: DUF4331 domain-containing protein, partial [Cytophagaceae bacterium]
NYYSFGENIRYEIHIKNNAATKVDDITYRFTFSKVNEDPTTFFNIRLGKENLKTTYKLEKITPTATTVIVDKGVVPPNNIGPRSITGAAGLKATSYEALMAAAITPATGTGGEKVFCGPVDDPFFVDLGGIFDLGQTRAGAGAVDGLAKYNVHTIALKIPITSLLKAGVGVKKNILDPDYVIGVWASASRPQIRTLGADGAVTESGDWVQISRIGMPLTNEAVIPIGSKDKWNAGNPYAEDHARIDTFFTNPELALYMDDSKFGGAVPAFSKLRIQTASKTVLGAVDFRNGKDGLFVLKGNAALKGTALDDAVFGTYLLRDNQPRSVDLLPIFHMGVPNVAPYQLATGKTPGNPLSPGKPFINNFIPTDGDMLRLNMAVPVTPRNSTDFSNMGLLKAAVLGLTDARFNTTTTLQNIPNMDGFPNGRRLEDDVTTIELQAVGGVVLAAIGLWYDDYDYTKSMNPVTPQLGGVLGYSAGVGTNDTTFRVAFPYEQTPWNGFKIGGFPGVITAIDVPNDGLGIGAPAVVASMAYPNPFMTSTTIKYTVNMASKVKVNIYTSAGQFV